MNIIPMNDARNVYLFPGMNKAAEKAAETQTLTLAEIHSRVMYYYYHVTDIIDTKDFPSFERFMIAIKSKSRIKELVEVRQVFAWCVKHLTHDTYSLTIIGRKLGHRDHSTIIHSIKTVNNYMATDKVFNARITKILNYLNQ